MRTLGESTGEMPKTPTLRQAIRARLNIPQLNLVTLVFKPGKFPAITLQCEDLFRVNVREDEPLYRDVIEVLGDLIEHKLSLFVEVPKNSEGRFVLLIDEASTCEWEENDWGFRMTEHKKPSKRAGKTPRATLNEA